MMTTTATLMSVEGWIREYRSQIYALTLEMADLRAVNPAHLGIPVILRRVIALKAKVYILEGLQAPVFTAPQQRVLGDAYRAIVDASADIHDELRHTTDEEAKFRIYALCKDLEGRLSALTNAAAANVEPQDPRRV